MIKIDYNELGDQARRQGDYQLAIKYFQEVVNEGDDEALENIADLYTALENIPKAVEYYQKLVATGVNLALTYIGDLFVTVEEFSQTEKYYKLAVKKEDDVSFCWLLKIYDDTDQANKVEKYLKVIYKLKPQFLSKEAAIFLIHHRKDYARAIEFYEIIENKDEDDYRQLIESCLKAQQFAKGIKFWHEMISNIDEEVPCFKDNYSGYIQDQKEFSKVIDEDIPYLMLIVADCYRGLKEYDKAIDLYQKYLPGLFGIEFSFNTYLDCVIKAKKIPEMFNFLNNVTTENFQKIKLFIMGYLHDKLGNKIKAEYCFEQGLAFDKLKNHFDIALLYSENTDYETAIEWCKKGIKNGYKDEDELQAICYEKLKKYDEAIELYKKDIEEYPENTFVSIAYAYEQKHDFCQAIKWYKKALKYDDYPMIWIGDCYYKQQNYNKAIQWYRKAQKHEEYEPTKLRKSYFKKYQQEQK